MALDLVAIGEGMVEFHAEGGGFGEAQTFRRGFAGDVVNCLISASRLGLKAALLSRIGADAFAPAMVRVLSEEGIDLSHAPLVAGANGIYFILTDERGEREFLYRRAGSAASRLGSDDLDRDFVAKARYVLISGIAQAISASAERLVAAAASMPELKRTGVYDPNYRPKLWRARGGEAAARRAFRQVAPRMAWLLPSYPADLPLFAIGKTRVAAEIAKRLADAYGVSVALKLGQNGALIHTGDASIHVPAAKVDTVVDTTGAGDAWNAAFLAGLARGIEPVAAAEGANAYAAGALRHRGAVPPRLSPLTPRTATPEVLERRP